MKTFRLIGMALITILVSVNFTSCSSDDEEEEELIKNDDGVVTNQKKLMRIDIDDSDTWDFTYDSKGRLVSINYAEKYDGKTKERVITNYTWSDNAIMAENNYDTRTYSLNNNLVRTIRKTDDSSWKRTFAYNSSNQVVNIQTTSESYTGGSYTNTASYTWNNDKIVKITYTEKRYNDEVVYEYTYSGKTCKGWFPNIDDDSSLNADGIFLVHPELVGMRTNQLPEQIFNKDIDKSEYYYEYYKETCKYESIDEDTAKFDYTLNKDGYLESCTVTYTSVETIKRSFTDKNGDGIITEDERNVTETSTDTDIDIFTFTWE